MTFRSGKDLFKGVLITVSSIISIQASANSASYIVKLKPEVTATSFQLQNNVALKAISVEAGLYQATPLTSGTQASGLRTLSAARARGTMEYAVPNHPVQLRAVASVPNDLLLGDQWGLQMEENAVGINAIDAWPTFGQGGRDKSGNEIVVAIVDGGFDHNHSDLYLNRWRNSAEIAGNGKDDDGNGYIDDVNGWNASADTGRIDVADHGTHVAGIIGARGNNGRGISGVNQRVKMMYVSASGGGLGDTVTTMKAYGYILKQKKMWLETKGRRGANVVAINSSFGIDAEKCSDPDFTVWNDMINQLGAVGILSVGATSNLEINVDKHGDIPTSCDSPYMVAVTNSMQDGQRSSGQEWDPTKSFPSFVNSGSGFGAVSIDLAAPGTEILSAAQRAKAGAPSLYTAQSGTSFSAPHVSGAIGYLHSVASRAFNERYLKDPASGALELKKAMLETVTPMPDLQTEVASGGILNLFESAMKISQAQ